MQVRNLAAWLARHRIVVLVTWLALIAVSLPLAASQTDKLTAGGFDVPGSESAAVAARLADGLAADSRGPAAGAVLVAEPTADSAARRSAIARLADAVDLVGGLEFSDDARRRAEAALIRRGKVLVGFDSNLPQDELTDRAVDLRERVDPGASVTGVSTYLTGQHAAWAGVQELSKEDLAQAEVTGFPIIAVILLVVFGSAAAASLPLALGFGSVIVTGAIIFALSRQMEMSVFVTNMASMIGIGVAVDYSLFILARYREEVSAGKGADEARAIALETSGRTVLFSGTAVIISLAGLWMVDNQALRSMALGAMVVVAVSMLTAVILLPALIRLLGGRVMAGGIVLRALTAAERAVVSRLPGRRWAAPQSAPDPDRVGGDFWHRWTARVMQRPLRALLLAGGVMLLLASPIVVMETGNAALAQFPTDHDVRIGSELAAELGGGSPDPGYIVAEFGSAAKARAAGLALAELRRRLRSDQAVASVAKPIFDRDVALVAYQSAGPGDSDRSLDLVERLRTEYLPDLAPAIGARSIEVGGETARMFDVNAQISGSMWKIVAFILAFSFLVLMVMLRSILLPLKAVLMNLLSISAAYGVLVAIFQWGVLDSLLGFDSLGAIDTLNPPLILAVVFGLSMDYEVFLLSRIRERYAVHADNQRAVAEGLASSARTITSAAAIMSAVFGVFALTGVPSIKELGVGNAIAVGLDATLVRLVLVPAAMRLMGDWNWWLPTWLDRLLPHIDLERSPPPVAPGAEPTPDPV